MAREPRLRVPSMKDYMMARADRERRPVNRQALDQLHGPATIIYQTNTTLDTDTGPGLRMPRGGQVRRIAGRVAGAPSGGNLKVSIFIDGVSVFDSGEFLLFQSGEKVARFKIIRRPYFNEDSVFTVDIDTISSATGPMILTIEYLPEF